MNDFFLFVGIIIFFFVLWVYNGGPNQPISFAGPYITPVTDVGVSQVGYGGSANTYHAAPTSFWGSWGFSGGNDVAVADRSTVAGTVRIGGGNIGATEARDEYLTLSLDGDTPVNITGWQLVSTKTGAHATIGEGVQIANYNEAESSIVLTRNDRAIITTGRSPIDESFRETECTGYLDPNYKYSPSLSGRCPSPMDELADFYVGNAQKYDQCHDYVSSLSSCRVPSQDAPAKTPSSCQNFVDSRLSYKGCVSGHRSDADFSTGTWRIFLEQSQQLWRGSNDTIQLRDRNGKVVDQYSY